MRSLNLLASGVLVAATVSFCQSQTICIDPGHPSESGRGTHGKHTTEIGVAWRMATLVAAKLRSDGYTVVLTKDRAQKYVSNRKRAEIANKAHASLFLRLHCDASAESGIAVYYPSSTGRAPDGHRGPSAAVLKGSSSAAKIIHREIAAVLSGKLHDRGLKTDKATAIGGRQGALTGSVYSNVPTVLVEMVVLTNPKDEAFIRSKKGETALADALTKAAEAAVAKNR